MEKTSEQVQPVQVRESFCKSLGFFEGMLLTIVIGGISVFLIACFDQHSKYIERVHNHYEAKFRELDAKFELVRKDNKNTEIVFSNKQARANQLYSDFCNVVEEKFQEQDEINEKIDSLCKTKFNCAVIKKPTKVVISPFFNLGK